MKRASHIKLTEKQFESEKRYQFKLLKRCFYGDYGIMLGSWYFPLRVKNKLDKAWDLVKEAHEEYLRSKTHRTNENRED